MLKTADVASAGSLHSAPWIIDTDTCRDPGSRHTPMHTANTYILYWHTKPGHCGMSHGELRSVQRSGDISEQRREAPARIGKDGQIEQWWGRQRRMSVKLTFRDCYNSVKTTIVPNVTSSRLRNNFCFLCDAFLVSVTTMPIKTHLDLANTPHKQGSLRPTEVFIQELLVSLLLIKS